MDFWWARDLLDVIRECFEVEAPELDRRGWVTYYAKHLPEEPKRWHEEYGSHWHGTRLQCLNNILVRGLRDSNPNISEGSRVLTSGSHIGVYLYADRDWATSSYCLWQDFVGDQVYWATQMEAAVDYARRITPTVRKQIVIPQRYVHVRSLRFNICRYEPLPHGCLILPVWVPMLEAAHG